MPTATGPESQEREGSDERFMRVALNLAQQGRGSVEPNPMVGCVLVRDGRIVGRGYHPRFGGPHAEIVALSSLDSPEVARGATAFVTLEPCCHHGKTPPCSQALIEAGVGRVVVAMEDPFASVSGGGLRELREAGIDVTVGPLVEAARRLNAPYLKRIGSGRPWIIAKWAMTVDGRIATATGHSQWITGESARADVHRWRGMVDAIVVGMGTVEADDPLLTARPAGPRVATRVVFCRRRLPRPDSKLAASAGDVPLCLITSPEVDGHRRDALARMGATIVPTSSAEMTEMVLEGLDHFGVLEMSNVIIEGGGELLACFFSAGQVDQCHVYLGAKAFGGTAALGPIGGVGVKHVAQAWSMELESVDRFDDDLRLIYRL